jgi:hypothetical protein
METAIHDLEVQVPEAAALVAQLLRLLDCFDIQTLIKTVRAAQ